MSYQPLKYIGMLLICMLLLYHSYEDVLLTNWALVLNVFQCNTIIPVNQLDLTFLNMNDGHIRVHLIFISISEHKLPNASVLFYVLHFQLFRNAADIVG